MDRVRVVLCLVVAVIAFIGGGLHRADSASATSMTGVSIDVSVGQVELERFDQAAVLEGYVVGLGTTETTDSTTVLSLEQYSGGGHWVKVVDVSTNEEGAFAVTVKPARTTTYRFAIVSREGSTVVLSRQVTVVPRAGIAGPLAPTAVRRSAGFTVKGRVDPVHDTEAAPVRIYRWRRTSGGKWKSYGFVKAPVRIRDGVSVYETRMTLPARGRWRLQAVHAADSDHAHSVSAKTEVRVVGSKLVALTFDDGPAVKGTPEVLAALRKYDARATFFLLGHRVKRHPGLVREIAEAGHQVGNHRYTHKISSVKMDTQDFRREVSRTERAIESALKSGPKGAVSHRYPIDFRYPWGAGNRRTNRVLAELDVRPWRWTYGPGDGGNQGSYSPHVRDLITRKVLSNVKPGAVILLHDSPNQPNTVAALPAILRSLSSQGYDFVTVEELRRLKR